MRCLGDQVDVVSYLFIVYEEWVSIGQIRLEVVVDVPQRHEIARSVFAALHLTIHNPRVMPAGINVMDFGDIATIV